MLFPGNVSKLIQVSGERPQRSTRGKGGARAQLAAVADLIRPDLNPGVKRPKTKEIPKDVPFNAMAPPTKRRRGVYSRFSLLRSLLIREISLRKLLMSPHQQ